MHLHPGLHYEKEHASLELEKQDAEKNKNYSKWLQMLIAPGGSMDGARPKASVVDTQNHLWIAKFPSTSEEAVIFSLSIFKVFVVSSLVGMPLLWGCWK